MNTNYRTHQIQSGQSLALGGQGSATLFLAEGEVLLQAPAQWLGDTVVHGPTYRVVAPAALPCAGIQTITAISAATIHVEEAASPLEKLGSAWKRLVADISAAPPDGGRRGAA